MTTKEMITKIEQLKEWEQVLAEAKAEVESLKDEIKQEMTDQSLEELEAGKYIVRYTNVLTQRFDTTAFKKALPEVYKGYLKQSASKRFTIA